VDCNFQKVPRVETSAAGVISKFPKDASLFVLTSALKSGAFVRMRVF
jgi:hypothetical protein